MRILLKSAKVYTDGAVKVADMLLDGAELSYFSGEVSSLCCPIIHNTAVFPGFADVHVHLREPGFSYKENIKTGTLASARGGYTAVCSMPNLNPTPDSYDNLKIQLDAIERDAVIAVYPYGTITKGEAGEVLSDMEDMAPYVKGYSDDGRGVQSEKMMRTAMERAKALGKPIVAHCEDNSLLHGGYIHDGEYAKAHGYEIVSVIPQPKAGGSFATTAYKNFASPVAVEEIRADAGIDIGGTLIGMHLKRVAVPVRLSVKTIGEANIICARTRPKFIGGCRAVYPENT